MKKDQPPTVDEALKLLKRTLARTVKQAQQTDTLTKLPNQLAMDEMLSGLLAREIGHRFWVAFIEVDHFKNINTEFGYDEADVLLIEIAKKVVGAQPYFVEPTQAFRPHGDEFFLIGDLGTAEVVSKDIERGLQGLRNDVGLMRLAVHGKPKAMTGTVSVSWLASDDLDDRQIRPLNTALEAAMDSAKLVRGTAGSCVRYTAEHKKKLRFSHRSDCSECGTKFQFQAPMDEWKADVLMSCPNCGHNACPRPTFDKEAEAASVEIVPPLPKPPA